MCWGCKSCGWIIYGACFGICAAVGMSSAPSWWQSCWKLNLLRELNPSCWKLNLLRELPVLVSGWPNRGDMGLPFWDLICMPMYVVECKSWLPPVSASLLTDCRSRKFLYHSCLYDTPNLIINLSRKFVVLYCGCSHWVAANVQTTE